MDPIQEILETVRTIRQAQIEGRETQLKALKTVRRAKISMVVFLVLFGILEWFLITHTSKSNGNHPRRLPDMAAANLRTNNAHFVGLQEIMPPASQTLCRRAI
jgi:hypothetical protein